MRVRAVFLAAAVVAVLVGGCGSSSSSGSGSPASGTIQELAIGGGPFPSLDVATSVTASMYPATSLAVEGLMRLDADGKVHPHLAQSVEHPDPKTYVYKLRKGVKFWNGNEMTAEDVAYSMNYLRNPKAQSASYYTSVDDITARDRYTVVVTLNKPDATWRYTPVFMSRVIEKKWAEQHKGEIGKPGVLMMGTGPWKIDSFNPTRGLELSRNDAYWGEKPQIDKISVKFFADETSMAVAMRAREIDVAFTTDSRAFGSTSGAELVSTPSCRQVVMSMNQRVAPWNDVHVRRAVAHAIDREGIANALGGSVTPNSEIVPQDMWKGVAPEEDVDRLYASLPTHEFDLENAKQELAQSKYPDGFSATINTTKAAPGLSEVNQAIASSLAEIGIDLNVKSLPIGKWTAQFYGPRSGIPVFVSPSGCGFPDPAWYPGVFLSGANARTGGTNIADFRNADVDGLIADGIASEDPDERLAAYGDMLKIVGEEVPYVALYLEETNLAISREFAWPGFHAYAIYEPWALQVEAR